MNDITVVMPTSAIRSHPDTAILEETVASVRHHLPDAEIMLSFDGLSTDNYHRHDDYEEYIRRALWLADHAWGNVLPLLWTDHLHQSGMMMRTLPEITTPLVLYVEHDTPLVTDWPIDWRSAAAAITDYGADLIRFHHEAVIPEPHQHMVHGSVRVGEINLIRTSQWSQRPHLASTAFYQRVMESHFFWPEREFIEDRMHSVVDRAYRQFGMLGWEQYRLHIYDHHGDGQMKRSYHLDGAKS